MLLANKSLVFEPVLLGFAWDCTSISVGLSPCFRTSHTNSECSVVDPVSNNCIVICSLHCGNRFVYTHSLEFCVVL